jgi:hypothetical protein
MLPPPGHSTLALHAANIGTENMINIDAATQSNPNAERMYLTLVLICITSS